VTTLFDMSALSTDRHSLPEKAVVSWLKDNGGHGDCEAPANAEPVVEEPVPGYEDLNPSANVSE
jgi:hypothetical protein